MSGDRELLRGCKPCPFCANSSTHFAVDASADGVGKYMRLQCSMCGCGTGQIHFYEDDPEMRQELRDAWNNRAPAGAAK